MAMRGPKPRAKYKPGWVRTEKGLEYVGVEEAKRLTDPAYAAAAKLPAPPKLDVPPWLKPGLSRSERVIVFCESFKITSGPDIGKPFWLRDWQRQFIHEV